MSGPLTRVSSDTRVRHVLRAVSAKLGAVSCNYVSEALFLILEDPGDRITCGLFSSLSDHVVPARRSPVFQEYLRIIAPIPCAAAKIVSSSVRKHKLQVFWAGLKHCAQTPTCHRPGYLLNTEADSPRGRKEYVTEKSDKNSFRMRLTFSPKPTSPLQIHKMMSAHILGSAKHRTDFR